MGGLAYGSFSRIGAGGPRRLGVRVGAQVLDLTGLAERIGLSYADLRGPVLNPVLAAGRPTWDRLTADVTGWLEQAAAEDELLLDRAALELHLPFAVADYVDFYSSEQHARNVGRIFRPDSDPLTPNWKHLPIGYHGRAGTVVVSGTPVRRPCGQRKAPDDALPRYGPSLRLDIEAEVGFVVGAPTAIGTRVGTGDFAEHVFGVVLVNDWSARDLQAWEYVPLGPFLGKSFATSVSAWVVPLAALAGARIAPPARDVPVLDYLAEDPAQPWGLDLSLAIELNGHVVSQPSFAGMYWTGAQQLAHLSVNGASLRAGDLFASGTVSDATQFGSLLELSWGGRDEVVLGPDERRTFLRDGDEVVITATAPGVGGDRIELGEVRGRILPAH